jgi:hypothetical protein
MLKYQLSLTYGAWQTHQSNKCLKTGFLTLYFCVKCKISILSYMYIVCLNMCQDKTVQCDTMINDSEHP